MEMEQFFPTESFDCDEDQLGFDSCVLQAKKRSAESFCVLPFQSWSDYPNQQNRICQSFSEGYASFLNFQSAYHSCKVPCTQLKTVFNYYMPQYLATKYLGHMSPNSVYFYYYLSLPSSIKVSKTHSSYGFVTFIAEVAGWYNLFLGGSIFAMWEVLGTKLCRALTKVQKKLSQFLARWQNTIYLMVSSAVLIYIFIDCATILNLNPVGSNILLTSSIIPGLCLSICLPQYTSAYSFINASYPFVDSSNTTLFWENGNKLSNKIFEVSVIMQGGTAITLWNKSQSAMSAQPTNLLRIFNVVSSDLSVDFCHTVDLSTLSGHVRGVQVRAVNDIKLAVHLAGQLLTARALYGVANTNTVRHQQNIFLYNSEVSLQIEETTFQDVNSKDCVNYNTTWTYDDCVLDFVIMESGGNSEILRWLLLPNDSSVQQGIEREVLQSLYVALLAQNVETSCHPDCRSLVVTIREEASPTMAQPQRGITPLSGSNLRPLPPLLVDINITMPILSKINQVMIDVLLM